MKQHITKKQLDELSGEAEQRLHIWVLMHKYTSSWNAKKLNIGQMIEFLDDYLLEKKDDWSIHVGRNGYMFASAKGTLRPQPHKGLEIDLCDALWEAVKEVLEKS